ncbi:MAG: transposase [Actinomycetota bacterium]
MLVLEADAGCLIDEALPEEAKLLPDRLMAVDAVLDDPAVLAGFRRHWEYAALGHGRPSLPMATYVRLMYIKDTTGWGYERLMDQVCDSLQLRRFCRIPVIEDVPDESTVRKLTRRLGSEVIDEATRAVVKKAVAERGFRPRALRVDSTVAQADVAYPTDVGLCADAVRTLAKAARKVRAAVPDATKHVVDRSRAVQKRVRAIGRSLRKRTGQAKAAVQALTEQAGAQVARSLGESRTLLAEAKASTKRTRGVSKKARARAIKALEELIGLSTRVTSQIKSRFAGDKIPDRLVSLFDSDARPVRRGKLAQPTEFGYVVQLGEVTASTKRGTASLLLPPKLAAGSTHENTLLPRTVAELAAIGITALKEASFDAGFTRKATEEALPGLERIFIAGDKDNAGSQRTRRRMACYRVGCEGRVAHHKREYHGGRNRLKGTAGAKLWQSWAALCYDIDTVAPMPIKKKSG